MVQGDEGDKPYTLFYYIVLQVFFKVKEVANLTYLLKVNFPTVRESAPFT